MKGISIDERAIELAHYIIDSKELEVKNNESNIRKNIKSFKIRNK